MDRCQRCGGSTDLLFRSGTGEMLCRDCYMRDKYSQAGKAGAAGHGSYRKMKLILTYTTEFDIDQDKPGQDARQLVKAIKADLEAFYRMLAGDAYGDRDTGTSINWRIVSHRAL